MTLKLHVEADAAALADAAARFVAEAVLAREAERNALSLSGGRTPRATYARLAASPWREKIPWGKVHFFFTDERHVSPDDPLSNLRMARDALFTPLGLSEANIHAVPTGDLDPDASARAYDADLARFFGRRDPAGEGANFDVVLLGLGEDGHTASLFPGNAALGVAGCWATAVRDRSVPEPRVTLTFAALGASRHTAFLVEGAGKRCILAHLLKGDSALPAARVPASGAGLDAFVDADAAGECAP